MIKLFTLQYALSISGLCFAYVFFFFITMTTEMAMAAPITRMATIDPITIPTVEALLLSTHEFPFHLHPIANSQVIPSSFNTEQDNGFFQLHNVPYLGFFGH